jgi:hypothetical protein
MQRWILPGRARHFFIHTRTERAQQHQICLVFLEILVPSLFGMIQSFLLAFEPCCTYSTPKSETSSVCECSLLL